MLPDDDEVDHTITNVVTGEEMDEEGKAELRAMLKEKGKAAIRFAPGVEAELREAGIDIQEVLDAMMKGASNKLA